MPLDQSRGTFMRAPRWRVLAGDVCEQLAQLPANHYHVAVTSPPYYQQRDYGVPGQIGLEATLEEYVATMVRVFQEVRRVLRDDGTFWLNIGDKRAAGKNAGARGQDPRRRHAGPRGPKLNHLTSQVLGIPWRLALALQADGWQLRSDIIWHKTNPMPESTNRRTMNAHEYLFMFSKTPAWHFDAYAIMEEVSGTAHSRGTGVNPKAQANPKHALSGKANPQYSQAMRGLVVDKRLPRSVWSIPTFSLKAKHFAAFPPRLVERVLKAGAGEAGCCEVCGRPWKRMVKRERFATRPGKDTKISKRDLEKPPPGWTGPNRIGNRDTARHETKVTTLGWKPACDCHENVAMGFKPVVPCRAIDPFLGSGTTAMVAQRLGIDCDGIELSREYAALSVRRVTEDQKPKPPKRKRKGA
jgi:DNA modification methylase